MDAADRIRSALKAKEAAGFPRGWRGPKREQALVELIGGDILDVCAVAEQTELVKQKAASISPSRVEKTVCIQIDCAYALLDALPTAEATPAVPVSAPTATPTPPADRPPIAVPGPHEALH